MFTSLYWWIIKRKLSKGNIKKEVHLKTEEARQLREITGQLNWTSSQTRPDRSYAACEVNVSIKDATIIYLISANKQMQKLKSKKGFVTISSPCKFNQCSIICFSDATFANLKNASQEGYILFIYLYILFIYIFYFNYLLPYLGIQKRVVKSTLVPETLALQEALEACYVLRLILLEIFVFTTESRLFPIYCYTDNRSLLEPV